MSEYLNEPQSTRAARLTPSIPAGIATVGVTGPIAVRTVESLADLQIEYLHLGRIHYGHWTIRSGDNEVLGREQIVVCRTAEDVVEIHCHGGLTICKAILTDLSGQGIECVNSDVWPSSQTGEIARAAETDLLRAATDQVAIILLEQLQGAMHDQAHRIAGYLENGEDQRAIDSLEEVLGWSTFGQRLTQPYRVVLAGPPNVGKSSLLNRLVGQARSIVHADAGTTRDWIDSPTVLAGWPLIITDTAGLRETPDAIEFEGVRRARAQIEQADLLVLVVDVTLGLEPEHYALLDQCPRAVVIAWNKIDLVSNDSQDFVARAAIDLPQSVSACTSVAVSATGEPGVEGLSEAIVRTLIPRTPAPGAAVPFREQHVQLLTDVLRAIQTGDLPLARSYLTSLLA